MKTVDAFFSQSLNTAFPNLTASRGAVVAFLLKDGTVSMSVMLAVPFSAMKDAAIFVSFKMAVLRVVWRAGSTR
jgi:hypothetical protein